ncbi:hypothetical protein Tco_1182878 [Tanacetum coccineum]
MHVAGKTRESGYHPTTLILASVFKVPKSVTDVRSFPSDLDMYWSCSELLLWLFEFSLFLLSLLSYVNMILLLSVIVRTKHQLRVHEEYIPKTAFRTRYGHFGFTIMPFRLTTAPASKEDHEVHLKLVPELLKKEKLFAKFSKCEFWLQEVHFLGHVVNNNNIHVDPIKIEAVENWKAPKTPLEIRSYLGLVGYYRHFIVNFSKIVKPLTSLTQKNQKYEWGMD